MKQEQSNNLISVTDSFLGLDDEDKGCQNEEPYTNCTTRAYLRRVTQKCGCLPFALGVLEVNNPFIKIDNFVLSSRRILPFAIQLKKSSAVLK